MRVTIEMCQFLAHLAWNDPYILNHEFFKPKNNMNSHKEQKLPRI